MTPLLGVGVAVAGGLGAAARLLVDGLVRQVAGTRFPWGTTVINVSGSFLLGLVTALATGPLPAAWGLVIGTGVLGGYTTFSTASFETVRLLQERRFAAALMNGVGMLMLCVAAALGGFVLGGGR